ncbi:myotubularin-related protein (macronuclear) [Tetrahymena thermophila SB210]|uniref:Myotubularin-related protein n=1 Tax=Tetrahymena thermophila (strain SB210) TaxID=312017 RepID=I7MHG2_TETTS|nr:myotubularin-related protein [Tetrahymena thermophila SB210]EAR87507.2 myotubularin-related protein [Tetrahymena thermophila SB210]|eukprot:XP_001007752.2 myotubularin-related protein [Tetrahymena thermophila SB210]
MDSQQQQTQQGVNSNLQQVNIQKGRDPLGVMKTKPSQNDQFVINKNTNNVILSGDRSSNQRRIISFNSARSSEAPQNQFQQNLQQNQQQSQESLIRRESPPQQTNKQNSHKDNFSPIKKNPDPAIAIFSNYSTQNPFKEHDKFDDINKNRQSTQNQNNNNSSNSSSQNISNDWIDIRKDNQSQTFEKGQVKVVNLKGKDPHIIAQEQEIMFNSLKNMKVDRDFILKGEELKAFSETFLKFGQYMVEGKLILTNYKLIFVPNDEGRLFQFIDRKDFQLIPLGFIHKLERSVEKKGLQYSYIDITCKDGRNYRFRYQPECQNQSFEMQIKIHATAFPEDVRRLFSYSYSIYDRQLEDQFQGWQLLDIKAEFERQGVIIQPVEFDKSQTDKDYASSPFKYMDNSTGGVCSTYPPLIVVPSKLSNDDVIKCSKFRSRERLPALSFAFKRRPNSSYTTLWRCAQCKPGINSNRSIEDETFIKVIGCLEKNSNIPKVVKIYDARPYLNAVGQQITGKGYEQKQYYRNGDIEFLDIHNIHKVRESYKKMAAAAYAGTNEFLKEVDKSDWFIHISTIMEGTRKVVSSLTDEVNVVIHCSDGWDRTSQLICLAQMCIDPYFRTIEGFEVLIEKDWVQFGHQFCLRSGHASKNCNDDQRAPIFIQFLDCVYQLTLQYPLSFEFNSKFLSEIAHHYLSCRFGTFLYNSYQEQVAYNARSQTISLWSYLNSQRVTFENPFYLSVHDTNLSIIFPDSHTRRFSVWRDHFMIYQPGFCDAYKIYTECNFSEDNMYVLKRSSQMRYEQFREENKLLHKKIEELEAQLKALNHNEEEDKFLNNNNNNKNQEKQTTEEILSNRKKTEAKLNSNPLMQANFGAKKNTSEAVNEITEKEIQQNENIENQNILIPQVSDIQLTEKQEEFVSNQELDKAYIEELGQEKGEDFGSLNQDEIDRQSNLQSNSKIVTDTDKNEASQLDQQQQENILQEILEEEEQLKHNQEDVNNVITLDDD